MLASLEDAGGAEEHGDMRVVPARVHLPGDPALVLPLHGLLQPHTHKHGIDASSCQPSDTNLPSDRENKAASSSSRFWA